MGFWEGAGKNHQIDIEILQSIKVNSILNRIIMGFFSDDRYHQAWCAVNNVNQAYHKLKDIVTSNIKVISPADLPNASLIDKISAAGNINKSIKPDRISDIFEYYPTQIAKEEYDELHLGLRANYETKFSSSGTRFPTAWPSILDTIRHKPWDKGIADPCTIKSKRILVGPSSIWEMIQPAINTISTLSAQAEEAIQTAERGSFLKSGVNCDSLKTELLAIHHCCKAAITWINFLPKRMS